jgi:polynucleotide 5'-kinase involved in rRNA processing
MFTPHSPAHGDAGLADDGHPMITGCSGAGKTTIATVLACRGLAVVDADDEPFACAVR